MRNVDISLYNFIVLLLVLCTDFFHWENVMIKHSSQLNWTLSNDSLNYTFLWRKKKKMKFKASDIHAFWQLYIIFSALITNSLFIFILLFFLLFFLLYIIIFIIINGKLLNSIIILWWILLNFVNVCVCTFSCGCDIWHDIYVLKCLLLVFFLK